MRPHICNPNTAPVANGCHCGYWLVPVDSLKGIVPNRTHAYILPDDSVWALSHDETQMVLLRAPDSSYPTRIDNNDNFLIISGSGSYSVTIDLNQDTIKGLINQMVDLDGVVRNPTWNSETYTLVLPMDNGETLTIDLPVEQLIKGISFDSATNELVLTLDDGTQQRVPLNSLVVGLASEAWVTQQLSALQAMIKPTTLTNTDEYLIVGGSGTYSVTANINTAKFTQLIQAQLPSATDLSGLVKNPTWNGSTYTLVLPVVNGTSLTIDLPIEQLVKGMSFDSVTNELVLTLDSGAVQRVPLNALVVGLASESWVTQQLATLQASIKPTALSNTDGYLVFSGSGTYSVQANINTARFNQLIQSQLPPTTDLSGLVKNPTWNGSTYTLVLPVVNGTSLTIDLPVEQLIKGISFDNATKELVLTLDNGTQQRVPLNALVVGLASEAWVRANAVMLTGNQTVAGTKTFSETTSLARPQSSREPTADNDLVNKAYIDNKLAELSLMAYPVGSIYMSTSPNNPTSFYGGTWERWGNGRVPVGVDTTQTEFDAVNKSGGTKTHTLTVAQTPSHSHTGPSHTHTSASHTHTGLSHTHSIAAVSHTASSSTSSAGAHTHSLSGNSGSSGAHTHTIRYLGSFSGNTTGW